MLGNDLDSLVDEYERAFSLDPDVGIEGFAPSQSHPDYPRIVTELIRVEMELTWNSARRKSIKQYAILFPNVTRNLTCLDRIAFEEYRLRVAAGEVVTPHEYHVQYGIEVYHWPVLNHTGKSFDPTLDPALDQTESTEFYKTIDQPGDRNKELSSVGEPNTWLESQPELMGRFFGHEFPSPPTVESTLHRRLRFIGLTILVSLSYLSILAWFNPVTKVGLFLGKEWLLWFNGFCLLICLLLCVILWGRRKIKLPTLRIIEVVLFGSVVAELSCGLMSDVFVDDELARPFYEGEHELFHFASAWSLPFFALIVGYGTLIPSSWRRCTIVVSIFGILPILICTVAAVWLHGFSLSFFQSFLLQMIIWMATAAAIALYGVRRLEETQFQLLRSGQLGKYRLIRQIDAGGMGAIFQAEHTLLNRPCAIKLIHPKSSVHPQLYARFEREVQVLAGISHPNVVQIHDYGFTNDGIFYFVMEYLEGKNLEQYVNDEGPLSPEKVIAIMSQIADALNEIHRGGLVHRDVKPSNIFLASFAQREFIKLLDFGLTKSLGSQESDQQLTQEGAIIGTPAYMSPEQASGALVDHRTDFYSLGAVAYFALSGERVFDLPTTVETLSAHINATPPPVQATDYPIPASLQHILSRCLSKDPACRFQTATELSEALHAVEV